MFNIFKNIDIPCGYETITEVKDGVFIIKKVLYDKDGNEVIISKTETVLKDEIAKIDIQIKNLETKKSEYLKQLKRVL